jgi:Family of unknown function (DUF6263)
MTRARYSLALLALLAASARAQRLQLELRPKLNDTLRMRLDQITEMTGTRQGVSTKPSVTTLRMFSRAIVEAIAPASALILAVTDSVDVTSTDEHARVLGREVVRQLEGRSMRLRLSPDGTVGVAEKSTEVPKEVSELVAVMPASFPRDSVSVGDRWTREMPIAGGTSLGAPVGGVVRANFRLDSVSRGGDVAYVSMQGTLEQTPAPASSQAAAMSGSVNGNMVINRRRGWLSESRFLVQMRTTVAGRSDAGAASMAPMQFRMKITQHMRVFDKR